MDASATNITGVTFTNPGGHVMDVSGDAGNTYSIDVNGMGSIAGVDYTIPAHASGSVIARLNMLALTSVDIQSLNDLAMSMLSASQREEIKEEEKSGSANISTWSWFFGGRGISAGIKTKETMMSKGLSEEQISTLMAAFMNVVQNMSKIEMNVNINNINNDYSVSGNLYFYTISGKVTSGKETREYRMLADKGSAGNPPWQGGAPAEVEIVPLN